MFKDYKTPVEVLSLVGIYTYPTSCNISRKILYLRWYNFLKKIVKGEYLQNSIFNVYSDLTVEYLSVYSNLLNFYQKFVIRV